jgi:hypothetical protein
MPPKRGGTPEKWTVNLYRCLIVVMLATLSGGAGCDGTDDLAAAYPAVDRHDRIPGDISKRMPETDRHTPILYSNDYEEPIPLPHPVNTAGAEDSPFILPDGKTLYFFFTPDVRVPPQKQLLDGVTGIWVSHKEEDTWDQPQRVWLQTPGRLSLDDAACIQGTEMWFASAREGYTGVNMFTARWVDGKWADWHYAGDRLMKEIQIGEVHLYGDDLYFHSGRPGGKGGYDIWMTTRNGNTWSDPVNVEAVNSSVMDGYPCISPDGDVLWFTRTYRGTPGIFRSRKRDGVWSTPEMIVSQFAGEPSVDRAGNLYFVHHFFENGVMIEADIYVAQRK